MPTRSGFAAALMGVLLIIAAKVFGIFELYIVAVAILVLVVAAVLWVVLNWRSIQVTRTVMPPRLHVGQSSAVTLDLHNRRWLATPVAHITDSVAGSIRADAHIPPMRRGTPTKAGYRLTPDRRGRIDIGPMKTHVTDAFGLARVTRTSAPDASLLVLPRIDVVAPPQLPGGQMNPQPDRRAGRVGNQGEEFSALREYSIGDDLRKVHWPSTARSGELVVRTEEVPEHGRSAIVLDTRAHVADEITFERMVSAAASLVVACRDRDDEVSLAFTDGQRFDAVAPHDFAAILDRLATVVQTPERDISLGGRQSSGASTSVLLGGDDAGPLMRSAGAGATTAVLFGDQISQESHTRRRSHRILPVPLESTFAMEWNRANGRRANSRR